MQRLFRLFFVAVFAVTLAGGTGSASAAQTTSTTDTNVYTSELTGVDVELGEGFTIDNTETVPGRGVEEEFVRTRGETSTLELIFIEGGQGHEAYSEVTLGNLEQNYENVQVVDDQSSGAQTAWFGTMEYQGDTLYFYWTVTDDRFGDVDFAALFLSWSDTFAADYAAQEAAITVDGEAVYTDMTSAQMDELLANVDSGSTSGSTTEAKQETTSRTSRTSRTSSTEATATATEASTTSRTSRTSRTSTGQSESTPASGDTGTTTSRTSRTSTTTQESTPATTTGSGDWESMGLVSDSEWVSPTYDVQVTWDTDSFYFDEDVEFSIQIDDAESSDTLLVRSVDSSSYAYVTVMEAGSTTPQDSLDWWQSAEFAQSENDTVDVLDTYVDDTTATIVYNSVNNSGNDIVVVQNAYFREDGLVVYVQMDLDPTDAYQVYRSFLRDVQIDGEDFVFGFTAREIRSLIN